MIEVTSADAVFLGNATSQVPATSLTCDAINTRSQEKGFLIAYMRINPNMGALLLCLPSIARREPSVTMMFEMD